MSSRCRQLKPYEIEEMEMQNDPIERGRRLRFAAQLREREATREHRVGRPSNVVRKDLESWITLSFNHI